MAGSAVFATTEIAGRTFALYPLHFHLPGYAHHRKPPTSPEAWEGSKHKALAEHINAEEKSTQIIVGGDFNEWTDGLIMKSLPEDTGLDNTTTEQSIDHILSSTGDSIKHSECRERLRAKEPKR